MRTFKTFDTTDQVTRNFLQLCYMCDDNDRCTTEEECRQCWADQGLAAKPEVEETRELLNAYYA
ncbi:hypothetical protein AZ66_17825 [Paenibacillus sp. E194]|jgi:hypothetical protein|uniref:Uncharacterized protein n=1 Tax=Paenibacillus alvei TS-15 TaxID=1117108 RepID=S9TSF4_PAEAL|nr:MULTISPECIES: hypothetical protein [Paenibacillus]EPY05221.1 hypothetical protein PAALTS15_21148 [Paenibacillus alvei TS-15]KJB86615.1 hypothetical protein AZ66_17825 [Paenibacillus sp. E194]